MRTKLFLSIALLSVTITASAQFTNARKQNPSTSSTNGWSSIYVEWNPSKFHVDSKLVDDESFTGLTLGLNYAFPLSTTSPFYMEVGGALQYSFNTEKESGVEEKFSMVSMKVPVNLIYEIAIPNSDVSIDPFVGLSLRGNVFGKLKYEYGSESYDIDIFDKKDMDDEPAKRIQVGWQIGARVKFARQFYISASYGTDFSEFSDKVKIHTTSVSLGLCF